MYLLIFNKQQLRETKILTSSCMVSCASDMLVLKFPIITSTIAAAHAVLTVFICSLIFTLSYCFFFLWQQAALVLNASRRFRYTLDLKKEEEKEQIRRKIRAHAALAIMACTAMILIGGDIDTNVTCHECHVHVQYI